MTSAAIAAVVLAGAGIVRVVLVVGSRRAGARIDDRTASPWLSAPHRLAEAMADADAPWPADSVWTLWLGALPATGALGWLLGGPGLAGVLTLALGGAPVLVLAATKGRAGRRIDAALPALLEGVARSLRSGATLRQALGELAAPADGRLGDELRVVLTAVDGGRPLVTALDELPARCPTPGIRLAVAALSLSVEAGGGAARAIDGVAATLRANRAVAGEIRAQAAQARFSALVIAVAPLAFGALAASADPRTADFLLRTPVGLLCLLVGLGLDAVAAWWMHRITMVAS